MSKGPQNSQHNIIMEQVAMYMAALPCPPMPLLVNDIVACNNNNRKNSNEEEDEDEDQGRKEEEKTSSPKYCNSHDFIASMLLNAMALDDKKLNEQRKIKQMELTDKLLQQLKAGDPGKAYTYFSEFTAGYICAFANIDVGVTFLPMDDVKNGDAVHRACCSWNRAQSIILREPEKTPGAPLDKMGYKDLLALHCGRFAASEK